MSNSLTSIKIPTVLVDAARVDAAIFSRSVGGQVEHWAKIGRAIESAPSFTFDRVRAALDGKFNADELSDVEWAQFEELIGEAMGEARTDQARAFLASFEGKPNTDL